MSPLNISRAKIALLFAVAGLLLFIMVRHYVNGRRQRKPGIATPGIRRNIADLHADATYRVAGNPDWMAITPTATWVTSADDNKASDLDPTTNRVSASVNIPNPCSGLAADFNSLWVPSCDSHALFRVDLQSAKIVAKIPVAPADSEGGITTGAGSVWMPTSSNHIARINPASNSVIALIDIPSGSYDAAFGDDAVWITSTKHNLLTRIDPQSNRVTASIPTGPQPRFLTVGAGSVWTLNQGDGTISRVDMKTNQLIATIPVGIPGIGGEIAFGEGAIWVTVFQFPLTRIDPALNQVTAQWAGPGGDSVRVGNGWLWLTDYSAGTVSRLKPPQ